MNAKVKNGALFKAVIDTVRDMVKEARLKCGPDGIRLQCTDSSTSGMIAVYFKDEFFEDYMCDEMMHIGVNFHTFAKVLCMLNPEDAIILSCGNDGDRQDHMTVEFDDPKQRRLADFEMKVSDVECDEMDVPPEEYQYEVRMPSKQLREKISHLKEFGENLEMSLSEKGTVLKVFGDIGSGNLDILPKESSKVEDSVEIDTSTPGETLDVCYGVRYLHLFTKNGPQINKQCSLKISQGEPLQLEYALPDDKGFIRFYLAPKDLDRSND